MVLNRPVRIGAKKLGLVPAENFKNTLQVIFVSPDFGMKPDTENFKVAVFLVA